MKWKKKIAGLLLCAIAVSAGNSYGMDKVDIVVNGTPIKTDTLPYVYDGTTFVPVRVVSEALQAKVLWEVWNANVKIQSGDISIELPVGKNYGIVDGEKVQLRYGSHIVNNRTFVPVRFIAESLGAQVYWDSTENDVHITKADVQVPEDMIQQETSYTEEDLYWLSRIIHAESGGEPLSGKIAVGNVILNRVKSTQFPNTIYGVIFDDKYGVQFQPVSNGTIYNEPSQESVEAAKRALKGESVVGESLYFLNPRIATNFWIVNNRTYHSTIGGHDFYL